MESDIVKTKRSRGKYNNWPHKESRLNDIKNEIEICIEQKKPFPAEWIQEWNELTVMLEKRSQEKHAMIAKDMRKLRENRLYRCQCTRCGKDKPADGYTQCEECRDYRAEYLRKRRSEGR